MVSTKIPTGFTLLHILRGHKKTINRIAWSPDGKKLASPANDHTIKLWNVETGQLYLTLSGSRGTDYSIAWSPDGQTIASAGSSGITLWDTKTGKIRKRLHSSLARCLSWSPDGLMIVSDSDTSIQLIDVETGKLLQRFIGHVGNVTSVAWSPDGRKFASGAYDKAVNIWEVESDQPLQTFIGHTDIVHSVVWTPDGQSVASSSSDRTIWFWDIGVERGTHILEGHVGPVFSISFSADGRFLISKSGDGTVCIWRSNPWEAVAAFTESISSSWYSGIAFNPKVANILATLGDNDKSIRVWDLDFGVMLGNELSIYGISTDIRPTLYANAKVVLVGDTSVGKSGLSLVLTDQPFIPTDSTHGRRVWTFDNRTVKLDNEHKETREILLWDLAGQPGYRLVHQLHLDEVIVALVVFDAHSETDPFAGVHYWDRALRLSHRIQGQTVPYMKKLLIAARTDRGGRGVSHARINTLMHDLSFDGYFETSAREHRNVAELKETIHNLIAWEQLPKVSSTDLFQHIKAFLIAQKEARRILSTVDDLYRTFLKSDSPSSQIANLYAQFETCIGRLESRDLIRRLSFGNLILLQPELLDSYASALVNAVKDEPDGLGNIAEEKAQRGDFFVPKDERLKDKEQERLLLVAMVEDLLLREIAFRERADDGPYLVFPSQRESPDLVDPEGKEVIFSFEGPVLNIYATLAVRLSHTGVFEQKNLWRNAITYTTKTGGTYGIFLHNIGEGCGELTLFFDKSTSEEMRFHFEEYIKIHLLRRAIPERINRSRIFTCSTCSFIVTDQLAKLRFARGFNWLDCPVCDTHIPLLDREERVVAISSSFISEMDRTADSKREIDAIVSRRLGTGEAKDEFDVFLCYNSEDRAEVMEIGRRLRQRGILPWLDEWELQPGLHWQRLLEQQISQIKSATVFVGKNGLGPWQHLELDAILREFIKRGNPVIPVLLANAPKEPQLPLFIKGITWVDFRKSVPDPMERLIWGITGKRTSV